MLYHEIYDKINGFTCCRFAGPFQPRHVREKDGGGRKFTNVYIKNIGCEVSKDKLQSMCEKFGEITSICVPLDEVSKKSKGFGFVAFKTPESAAEVSCFLS